MTLRPLTPKEFSAAIGGLRTADWVRAECAKFVAREAENDRRAKRGQPLKPCEGIRTLSKRPPYIIAPSELERFRPSLADFCA